MKTHEKVIKTHEKVLINEKMSNHIFQYENDYSQIENFEY